MCVISHTTIIRVLGLQLFINKIINNVCYQQRRGEGGFYRVFFFEFCVNIEAARKRKAKKKKEKKTTINQKSSHYLRFHYHHNHLHEGFRLSMKISPSST